MSGNEKAKTVEFHRPYIDEITITCPECGRQMKRVPEVIDCWFDSGAMPFAQHHYPFENKELFEQQFPANFISEAVDPVAETSLTDGSGDPVDGLIITYQIILHSGHLDEPGLSCIVDQRSITSPAERIIMLELRCIEQLALCVQIL